MKNPEDRIKELEAALEAALESGYSSDHWDAVEIVMEQHLDQLYRLQSQVHTLSNHQDFLTHMLRCSMYESDKRIIKNMVATSKFFDVPLKAIMRWAKDHNPEILNVTTRYYVIDVLHHKIIDTSGGEPYFEYLEYIKEGDDFLKNSEGKNLNDSLNE